MKKKTIFAIIAGVLVVGVIITLFAVLPGQYMGGVAVVDFGQLVHLDPMGYDSYEDRVILDIDNAHDVEHTTYRILIDNIYLDDDDEELGMVGLAINEETTSNTLKVWKFGWASGGSVKMSDYMYDEHFEFEGIFDIEDAEIGTTYIIQLTVKDEAGVSITIYKFFSYEDIEEETTTPTTTPPDYEMPEVLLGTKDVSFTDSIMQVSFSVENYEHVTSITGFFTIDGEIVEEEVASGFIPITFGFTRSGELYEGEYDISLLPKNDMFLCLKVFYLDENGAAADFIVEEFEELLLGIVYYSPEVLIETRVIDFVEPILTISFSVANYEHVTGIIGFFEIEEEKVTDNDGNVITFGFIPDTDGFYEGVYNTQYLPAVSKSVGLQVTFFDENGQEDFFVINDFAEITSEGEVVTPTVSTAPIPIFTIIMIAIAVATIMIVKRKRLVA